jgi:hypothetical protein
MAIVYASFGVIGSKWLLFMHILEFQGLNGYYICVLWSFRGQDFLKDAPKTFSCIKTWGTNLAKFYIHIWFNINIIVKCPRGSDDVSICVDMLKYFFVRVYFDMSPNLFRNIPFDMDQIYLEYSFVHLFTCSCSYSHVHKIECIWLVMKSFLFIILEKTFWLFSTITIILACVAFIKTSLQGHCPFNILYVHCLILCSSLLHIW